MKLGGFGVSARSQNSRDADGGKGHFEEREKDWKTFWGAGLLLLLYLRSIRSSILIEGF